MSGRRKRIARQGTLAKFSFTRSKRREQDGADSGTFAATSRPRSPDPPRTQVELPPHRSMSDPALHSSLAAKNGERNRTEDGGRESPALRSGSLHRREEGPALLDPASPPPATTPELGSSQEAASTTPRAEVQGLLDAKEGEVEELGALGSLEVSGAPLTDTAMKNMLLILRQTFLQDMQKTISPLNSTIDELGGRIDHPENKMEEFSESHNILIDSHTELEEEVVMLREKIADLEDRSRRNNLKLRGVPESIQPMDIPSYVRSLIQTVLPDCTPQELEVDRAHRIPKPRHLDESVPRDILARVHFFYHKRKNYGVL
ncbi:uncharacterized protein LOC130366998 [Hyla sarda]|uniref:uncharacterized protein LOC130366998 n=1 Tax=Hyla sarda TaxID=327740 RepID=UPI0024C3A4CE|nr:uncharacterized protein LOC130366998 [Hyla sarda]